MSRAITNKQLQVVTSCKCGATYVEHDNLPIRYKDFSKVGIVRKKDASTGQPFLLQKTSVEGCESCIADLRF